MKKKGTVIDDPSSQIRLSVSDVEIINDHIVGIIKNADCTKVVTDPIENYIFNNGTLTLNKADDYVNGFGILVTPSADSQTHPTNTKIRYGNSTKYGKIIALSTLRKL